MLYQALHWPKLFDIRMWPFALTHAVYLWNIILDVQNRLAPLKIYTATNQNLTSLCREKLWGCPAYVLDPTLQDGKKIPKWYPKRRRGKYVGKSTNHASSVRLIRNLSTGYISPQYHVIYDNEFQTVMGGFEDNEEVATHI